MRLGKDSFLGKFGVDLSKIDLSQLMGGPHLTIPCTISHNGYAVKLKTLADSGANGFIFLDTSCAIDIARFLHLKAERLSQAVPVKGYDGKTGSAISHILRAHITIDGRRFYNVPFLILDLGSHDCIIGRKWLDHFNVLVDARHRSLIWPDSLQPSYSAVRHIEVPRRELQKHTEKGTYQADVDSRERAFEVEDQRRAAGRAALIASITNASITRSRYYTYIDDTIDVPKEKKIRKNHRGSGISKRLAKVATDDSSDSTVDSQSGPESDTETEATEVDTESDETQPSRQPWTPKRTAKGDYHDSLQQMADNLAASNPPRTYWWDKKADSCHMTDNLAKLVKTPPYKKRPYIKPTAESTVPQSVDIHAISPAAFHFNIKDKEAELFTTSIYEIDQLIEERQEADDSQQVEDGPDWEEALKKVLPVEY